MYKIAIIGAGISGLSLAYYLKKHHPDTQITVFEKDNRFGGVIDSHQVGGYFFEKGPRTFPYGRAKELISLILELGLEKEIIFSQKESENRYICYEGELEKVPHTLKEMLISPLTKGLFSALIRDLFSKRGPEDESVQAFFYRHLGKKLTDQLIDPMALGIFGSPIETLSILSTFPFLKEAEHHYRSLAMWVLTRKKRQQIGGLFTLKGGISSLIKALVGASNATFRLNEEVNQLEIDGPIAFLETKDGMQAFDRVYIATAAHHCKTLIPPFYQPYFAKIASTSLLTVNMVYNGHKPAKLAGFGCLSPSKENEPFLGITFDSDLFKNQALENKTLLTLMLGTNPNAILSDKEVIGIAKKSIYKYLKINELENFSINTYCNSLGLPSPGHFSLMQMLENKLESTPVRLHGTYLFGPSINACVKASYKASKAL